MSSDAPISTPIPDDAVTIPPDPSTNPRGNTESVASGLRRRRGVFQIFNGLPISQEDTSEEPFEMTPIPSPVVQSGTAAPKEQLFVHLTINRVCRIGVILGLGYWSGWSLIPDEKRIPTSTTWVTFIVIMTDWIAVATVLDCLWPKKMKWYFRDPRAKFLCRHGKNYPLTIDITLFSLMSVLVALGLVLLRYFKRQDNEFLAKVELLTGFLGICIGIAKLVQVKNDDWMKWFFKDDYKWIIFDVLKFAAK
ncbi:hypothetical protein H0H92_015130 [Tricholoma furcatifolium]|nr:hypothetical protein H0H92_015130 [Tricholoma furcatifolium]